MEKTNENFWNADRYSQFLQLRTQPARDLLHAIPKNFKPKTIYDLGCGPGNSTILLKERWPHAKVIGIDSSPDMLEKARASYPSLIFKFGDIAEFSPNEPVDLICSNAAIQWLDHHEQLLPRLIKSIAPCGCLAVQIPNNFHQRSHQVVIEVLQMNSNWTPLIENLLYGALSTPLYQLPWYYDLLTKSRCIDLKLWESSYFHELSVHQDIFDWIGGTGLLPVLSKMKIDEQAQLIDIYLQKVAKYYPKQENGNILFLYQRAFMIGFKNS